MIRYYYGNLIDATITEGDVGCDVQYPITNINYLNKNLFTKLDDSGTTATATEVIDLVKIDFGAIQSGIDSAVIDLSNFIISLESTTYNIETILLRLYGSTDDSIYTLVDTLWSDTNASILYTETINDISAVTFTNKTYRYWKIGLTVTYADDDTMDWDIEGNINNLYIGNYLELPAPQFVPRGFVHKTTIAEAYNGSRFGIDTQGKRKTWTLSFNNLDDTDESDYDDFDTVNKQGTVPCYFESIEGSTNIIAPTFVRVFANDTWEEIAYENYSTTHTVEQEL